MKALPQQYLPRLGLLSTFAVGAAELANRLLVASVFWKSGMVKLQSWNSTLYLFEYEYEVPVLNPELAAYLGTAAELILPVFVALGLLSRFMGSGLFLFNLVAVYSYFDVLSGRPIGTMDHQIWGLMLLFVAVRGGGFFSLDNLLCHVGRKRGWWPVGN